MRWIVVLALLASCDKKKNEQQVTPTAELAASGASVPEKPTEEPTEKPTEKPDADPFEIKLRELGASDPSTLDQAKERLTHTIKDIVHEESTPDGYILTFSMAKGGSKMEADGRVHVDEDAVQYAVQVRRSIDGTPYKCSAIVQQKQTLPRVVDACKAAAKP